MVHEMFIYTARQNLILLGLQTQLVNIGWRGGASAQKTGLGFDTCQANSVMQQITLVILSPLYRVQCTNRTELAAGSSWSPRVNGAVQRHQLSFFQNQHSPGAMYVIEQAPLVGLPLCFTWHWELRCHFTVVYSTMRVCPVQYQESQNRFSNAAHISSHIEAPTCTTT